LPAFEQWLVRIREGDPAAASELVVSFTPVLRRVVRVRLARLRLVRLVDPLDICQAVLGSFFARVTAGWPPVESADQLTALLVTIARNKIRDEARRHTAVCRDHRRVAPGGAEDRLDQAEARDPTPSTVVAWKELYEQALRHLATDERTLLEERLAGRTWSTIAADRGAPACVLRQKLHRAVCRVRRRLASEAAEPATSRPG
jgi:DNA-directed RNA polymerase specialized sigma24 family protein